jgi:hypothetical protein
MSEESPYPPEFAHDVTQSVNAIIAHLNTVQPNGLRHTALMGAIMALTECLLKSNIRDPNMTYLMLLTAMNDVYKNTIGETPPDRILQ